MSVLKTVKRFFWVWYFIKQNEFSIVSKTEWAIHSRGEFEVPIVHLRDFIDGLNQILPVSKESQDLIIQNDIASILDLPSCAWLSRLLKDPLIRNGWRWRVWY